ATTLPPLRQAPTRAGLSLRRRSLRSHTRLVGWSTVLLRYSSMVRPETAIGSVQNLFHHLGQLLQRGTPGFHREDARLRIGMRQAAFDQGEFRVVVVDGAEGDVEHEE